MSEPQEGYGPSSSGAEQVGPPTHAVPPVPGAAVPGAAGTTWGGQQPGAQQPGGQEQWSYGYGAPPGWSPYAVPVAPARRRRLPAATMAAVVVVAAAAGVGIGHVVWRSSSPAASSTASGQSNGTSGNSGTGSTGNSGSTGSGGGSETNPFGSSNGNGEGSSGGSSSSGSGSTSEGTGGPSDVSAIAQKVDPALVDINSTFSYQSAEGAGTGIVLTSNGEILTNNHVINGATSISVTDVGNGKTYSATVVGYDDSQDIAVLQLQGASGLTTADIGSSSSASVGQAVVAIGNAGGVGGTPSSAGGAVTALNQTISASDELDGTSEKLSGLLEVNADVESGDSGGSLVNVSGQVIGIDTAASESYSLQSEGSGGQGYAIPINTAISIAQQIEAGQSSSTVHVGTTAFLGVMVEAASSQGSENGEGGSAAVSGAEIAEVVPNGAAQTAGLSAGDVITSLDGQSVTSAASLTSIVGTLKAGQSVSIGYTSTDGQSETGTVVLSSGPPA